jgi:uncharacterized membrane protein
MAEGGKGWTDQQVEQVVGNLLRAGVITAAALVFLGGVIYLAERGGAVADHRVFRGEPAELRSPFGVVRDALHLRSLGLIQLGMLLLVATPVARVIFSVYAFARQHDVLYVVVTLIVLTVLLYSLFHAEL